MKILIAIPCMDTVPTQFLESALTLHSEKHELVVKINRSSLIYDARNDLSLQAVQGGYDLILWLDSDIVFDSNLVDDMVEALGTNDFVTGIYHKRKPPYTPVLFKSIGYRETEEDGRAMMIPYADVYEDYPENEQFEVEASGFGCVLCRVSLLKEIWETRGCPFSPRLGFGEDMTACLHIKELGHKMFADPRIKIGHIGNVVIDRQYFERTQR